ncbi:MAG: bifunctional glutamate N-acetyltransferase/amino-acid acetyltransferase ArgJ [Opitutales bacterium]
MDRILENSNGIVDVPGFKTGAVSCDIRNRKDDRLDLALIYSERPCSAAGVFTRNAIKAAPVRLCESLFSAGYRFHGVVANSGNANACTGEAGVADAMRMASLASKSLNVPDGSIFVCSTGRIGERLPIDSIEKGIVEAAGRLASSEEESVRTADAILTSDTRRKMATAQFKSGEGTVTVAGIAKGAGMIQPNMATMLAFLVTDAAVTPAILKTVLASAVKQSFNAITVDGDMSTNDTVLLLANGASGIEVTKDDAALYEKFHGAVASICHFLAERIVSDGEKVTKVVEVCVIGAAGDTDAENVARAIGNSLLVKTSWFGEDPNWGRLVDAAGYSGARLEEGNLDISYGEVPALKSGEAVVENKAKWKEVVRANRFTIEINLNLGSGRFRLLATDLTDEYVQFNKSE